MKIIALAVLLTVMQTSVPVPRKTADDPAQATANVKSKRAPNQAKPLPPPAPVKTEANRPAESDSHKEHPENAEHDVRITKLPTVTVNPTKRDLADWGYWVFSLLLVLVGFLQVWLVYRTLGAIKRQAEHMGTQTAASAIASAAAMKSAEAAIQNVEVFVSKERARLRIEAEKLKLEPPVEYSIQEVWHTVANHGSTPAFVVDSGSIAYVSDSDQPSEKQVLLPPLMGYESVILPNAKPLRKSTFFVGNKLTKADIAAIDDGKCFVHVHGFIKYKDAFDRERETRFKYVWQIICRFEDGDNVGHWLRRGNEADNQET
jgi:hypothetical protein